MPGKKLLVADDSLTIQKVIRLALSNEGYEIQTVSDGNDAILQISLFRPDAVLIDISLPGKSAFEVKRDTNQHEDLAEIRFVLMSSAFEQVDEDQVSEVHFHGRLTKPFDPAHLRQTLSDVLMQAAEMRMEKTTILSTGAVRDPLPPPPPLNDMAPGFPPEVGTSAPSMEVPPPPLPDFVEMSGPIGFPSESNLAESNSADLVPADLNLMNPHQELPGFENLPDPDLPNLPDLPPLPEPPQETVQSLWDSPPIPPPNFTPPPAFPPAPSPPPPLNLSPGPSEMDSFQNDESEIKNLTESTIRLSGLDEYQWNVEEPSLRPHPQMMENSESQFTVEPPSPPGQNYGMPEFKPENAESSDLNADMEALVHQEVERVLARMTEKLLPELAEKIIKQEINKILSGVSAE